MPTFVRLTLDLGKEPEPYLEAWEQATGPEGCPENCMIFAEMQQGSRCQTKLFKLLKPLMQSFWQL